MAEHSIYKDIAQRTGGDVYIGVVGPVRSGKSTFIKRFMEKMVLPNISDAGARERAKDEMPQSAAGKTVMTTEPKFVPDNAVEISFKDGTKVRAKLVDCVGYLVEGAMGALENGEPRMVRTPWSEQPMPFEKAAEIGTKRVIDEHSTIGMLVTTDGTIGEIPRESYVEAENRIASELKSLGKPFAIVLNSAIPSSEKAVKLAYELEEKYGAPVALVSCPELDEEDVENILSMVLDEFPIAEVSVKMPEWLCALEDGHRVKVSVYDKLRKSAAKAKKIGDLQVFMQSLSENEYINKATLAEKDMGKGRADIELELDEGINLSPALINKLRRDAAERFEDFTRVLEIKENATKIDTPPTFNGKNELKRTAIFFGIDSLLRLDAMARAYFGAVFVPLAEYNRCRDAANGVYVPPVIMEHELERVKSMMIQAREMGAQYALVGNPSHLSLAREVGFETVGDFRLNVTNKSSLSAWHSLGITDTVVSPELTARQVRSIGGRAIVYGRIPLMITERCFMKENFGCDRCGKACLTDRKGIKFPIMREFEHRNIIFNSAYTYMGDKLSEIAGVNLHHFIFTTETPSEIKQVVEAFKSGKPSPLSPFRRMGKRKVDKE